MLPEHPTRTRGKPAAGEPLWEMAYLYPYQGDWSEEAYLTLETSRLIEFDDGVMEFLQ